MIYLASPYTDPDPSVQKKRFDIVCKAAAQLMNEGYLIFSPIAHTHPIALHGLPGSWGHWKKYDEEFLAFCKELWILKMPGWDKSTGINAEVHIMTVLRKHIAYLEKNAAGIWKMSVVI